jgi:hypothetical protein
VFYVLFIAEKIDAVGDKTSGDTTTDDVQTLLEPFSNLPPKSACFITEAFFWYKTKLPVLGLPSSSAALSGFPNYMTLD